MDITMISKLSLSILLLIQTSLGTFTFSCQYIVSKEHLDCSYASLLQLPIGLFNSNLKILNASHNKIPYLKQDSFYKLTKVNYQVDKLKTNEIQEPVINLTSRQQNQLEVVDLSWNSITYIHPESFSFASKLNWLSLANNKGLQMPQDGLFFIGNALKNLYLSYCNISDIGKHMFKPGKSELKELYLDHNIIKTINEKAFIYFEMLQMIDLSHNKIALFEVNTIIPLIQVRSLKLENNPLVCDCSARELYAWSVEQEFVLDNVTCISQNSVTPWSEMLDNVKCERNVRNRRRATDNTISDSEGTEKNPPVVLIITCVVVAVIVLVFLCACMLNNSHECMEAAGCLLICHHCYQ